MGPTVERCLRAGIGMVQIAEEDRVSHGWVSQSLDAFDTVSPLPLSVQGRPRKITHAAEGLLDFIDQTPTAYQDEIAEQEDREGE
jgi:hypothetical protein